jgi:hypothetical protein
MLADHADFLWLPGADPSGHFTAKIRQAEQEPGRRSLPIPLSCQYENKCSGHHSPALCETLSEQDVAY